MQAGPPGRHRLGAHLHPPAAAEPRAAARPVHPGQDRGHVQQRKLMQLIQVDNSFCGRLENIFCHQ